MLHADALNIYSCRVYQGQKGTWTKRRFARMKKRGREKRVRTGGDLFWKRLRDSF